MKTLDYVSKNIHVCIPAKMLYDELKMACVAYSILGINGKKDVESLLELLDIIFEDTEEQQYD